VCGARDERGGVMTFLCVDCGCGYDCGCEGAGVDVVVGGRALGTRIV